MHKLLLCSFLAFISIASASDKSNSLPRSTPEAHGVASGALLGFVNKLEQIDGLHSVMVLRRGHVIAEGWWEPYDAEHNHVLYSLSKSFTSTAVGFAVAEGKFSIDDEVLKFFPEEAPSNPTNNLKAMRVRDLLTMSTGHQDEPPGSPDAVSAKSFLAHPVPHLPGTHFKYNTPATFMQSAIVQKVTGQTVLEFLQSRLFQPLGITNPLWETNFQGISLGGYGLRIRTEDIAKVGQFYLQRGKWNGRQLLPPQWIDLATSRQTSNGSNPKSDWNQGYGFQFWRCRNNAYRGDGAFGQYCVVMPDQQAVVAITAGVKDMQAVLNVIWDDLLPAFQSDSLPANDSACQELKTKLGQLKISTPHGHQTSPLAAKILGRKFVFADNDQKVNAITFNSSDPSGNLNIILRLNGKDHTIPCGYKEWKHGRFPYGGRLAQFPDEPTAASFAWTAPETCTVKMCAYETPFHTTYTFKFDDDKLTVDAEANVAFGPTKRPQLVGRAD